MRSLCKVLVLLLPAAVQATSAHAQSSAGALHVIVEAEDASRLPGARVTAVSEDHLGRAVATTDARGVATLSGLAPSARFEITAEHESFATRRARVRVRSGLTTRVRLTLDLKPVRDEIRVTGAERTGLDLTRAVTGLDIGLELTESLPTDRSYQSYLQLVPGVYPTDPADRAPNPASRSGVNYREAGGVLGSSRDNVYLIEGIDVTDPARGVFGADLNTEIIQEQHVFTGGLPAEIVGVPGLVSNVVTKSGGNTLSGSASFYFQSDDLVEANEHAPDATFETTDTALTLGGPLLRDRAWIFGSYRVTSRDEDVVGLGSGEFLRQVGEDSDQGFLKLSWTPTARDQLVVMALTDPTALDGSFDRSVPNNRDLTTGTGGERFNLRYSRVFRDARLEASAGRHEGEFSRFGVDQSLRNDVLFRLGDTFTQDEELLGGFGRDDLNEHRNDFLKAGLEWRPHTSWGEHTVRGGVEIADHVNRRRRSIPGGATYTSLDLRYLAEGITAADLSNQGFTGLGFDVFRSSHFNGFVQAIRNSSNRDAHLAILDLDGDGTLTPQEVGQALVFGSVGGNPDGRINYDRVIQTPAGTLETSAESLSVYLQDSVQWGRTSLSLGVRAERSEHNDTNGEKLFTFDWELAPRVSLVRDLFGDGRHKLTAHFGRYYDPARLNLANTAGTLTEAFDEQQVYFNGEWLTYRTRGGDSEQEVFYAPTTRTPYTDDFQLGYQVDLGRLMSLEATLWRRETRDLLETYDLSLYALGVDGGTVYPGDVEHPDSLWLGLGYFGFAENPGSDVAIATLAGGARDGEGLELVFRKRLSNGWQALASYTYADAEGNSTSDSSTDLQGDFLYLDPRAPGREGTLPGLVRQLLKTAFSYHWNNGLQVGATYRWSSGSISNVTEVRSRRHVPIRVSPAERFDFAGIRDRWLDGEAVGAVENDSWGTLDLRLRYRRGLGPSEVELFVDVFNVFDDQATVRRQDVLAGTGAAAFGDGIAFTSPRRYFLGMRFSY